MVQSIIRQPHPSICLSVHPYTHTHTQRVMSGFQVVPVWDYQSLPHPAFFSTDWLESHFLPWSLGQGNAAFLTRVANPGLGNCWRVWGWSLGRAGSGRTSAGCNAIMSILQSCLSLQGMDLGCREINWNSRRPPRAPWRLATLSLTLGAPGPAGNPQSIWELATSQAVGRSAPNLSLHK